MTETAKEYATALFELARETDDEKLFADALAAMQTAFAENPAYLDILSAPNIPVQERRSLLEQVFAEQVPAYVLYFTELLCDKGHIREFGKCVREYEKLVEVFRSISEARVISAVPLTDGEKSALIQKLEKISGHIVTAQYEIDESLLGGVVVQMDDTMIDGSLQHQLKEVKEVIGI